MHKFLKDYSVIGVVLALSALGLGILFRVFNLENVSAWGDEVASLYYAQNLDLVFANDSHTPLYYFMCKLWIGIFPESIVSLRYFFISLSFFLTTLSSYILLKRRGGGAALTFLILWWLWPTEIIFSRQARHYSLYAEMTFLLLILWDAKAYYSRKMILLLMSLFQLLHPFTLIVAWYLFFYDFFRKKSDRKELGLYLGTSFPLIFYYGIRFLFYGKEKVFSNISWVTNDLFSFQKSLGLLFMGDSFPLTYVYPLPAFIGLFMLGLVTLCFLFHKNFLILIKQNEKLLKFLQLFLITLIVVEVFSFFFTNVRIGRYYVYLVPCFLYALLEWELNLKRAMALFIILVTYNMTVFKPWQAYEWDDQNVVNFKSYLKLFPPRELVICSNAFQMDYYFQKPYQACSEVALKHYLNKRPFYLFDLTGNDKILVLFLMNNAKIELSQKFNQAIFLSVGYPASK